MKKQFYLFVLTVICCYQANAQCPDGVQISGIVRPTSCTSTDGTFRIRVRPFQTPAIYESGYVRGIGDTVWHAHTDEFFTISGKAAGIYTIIVRNISTKAICTERQFVLSATYAATFTATQTAATGCNIADGKIVLGNVASTDSVSWISSITPTFSVVSSLSANTIPNLKPGIYYVIIKSPNGSQCFSTQNITVNNNGAVCPAATFCSNAYGANKFPNGNFGSGSALNGPPLPDGETTYGYTQLAAFGPEDGFYAIANSTDHNGANSGGQVFNVWTITEDHTPNDVNGYMMVVNANIDKDVVTEKTITGLCPNKTYQFSAYIRNVKPNTGGSNYIVPDLTFLIDGVGKYNTGDVAGSDWVNIGFTFKSSSANAKFSIRNNNPGGDGNDWVIDDIFVGVCAPTITMNQIDGSNCQNPATSLTANITDLSNIYAKYKWQVNKKDGSGFVDAVNGSGTGVFDADHKYTSTLIPEPSPITSLQSGWAYRLIVAEEEDDFTDIDCRYVNTTTLVIAQCGAVLPVKINNLNASLLSNNTGKISWQVAEQVNIKKYEIEKSIDGVNFNVITTVNADNESNYSFDDKTLNNGVNYYRIKIVSNEGKYMYSPVVTLTLKDKTTSIKIFPNPVQNRLFVWMPEGITVKRIVISDAIGQKMMERYVIGNSTNVADIEVNKLAKGVYNIQLYTSKNEIKNFSFIKK
ncbi:MAG: T9SS type A sorting domain-containing protein [Bacteroidota bacterium]